MILRQLFQLAHSQNLVGDPDLEPKQVRWLLVVNADGGLTGVHCTDTTPPEEEGSKKKPRTSPRTMQVPSRISRTSGVASDFLVDKPMYALGWEPGDDAKKQARAEEAIRAFAELVNECASDTQVPAVLAVAAFLRERIKHNFEWIKQAFDGHEVKPNDLCAFVLDRASNKPVHDLGKVKAWWKTRRAAQRGDPSTVDSCEATSCLITGEPIASSSLVPQVKIRGGQSSGAALVSFNAPAFASYGLDGSENAPISPLAAEAAMTGLRRLLAYDRQYTNANGEQLPAWNFILADDTVVTFWSDLTPLADALPDLLDPTPYDDFTDFLESKPEHVRGVYTAVHTGKSDEAHFDDDSKFSALTLSGAQGRVIVRGFISQSVSHTIESLRQHFDDLDIVRNCPPPKERGHPQHFALRRLIEAIAGPQPANKKSEGVHKALTQRFLEAALDMHRQYPRAALVRAVERWRAEITRDDWIDADLRDTRAAIVKAYLSRHHRKHNIPEITRDMDPNNKNPAYRLGCLMAVLEALQQAALGDVNASVVDKYFGAASASPGLVFPRMIKTARSHARKAQREKGGWAYRLENLLDEVFSKVEADGIPRSLSLEEQGLFGLGYHHMRHWLRMSKEDRAAWEAENAGAPHAFIWAKADESPTEITAV